MKITCHLLFPLHIYIYIYIFFFFPLISQLALAVSHHVRAHQTKSLSSARVGSHLQACTLPIMQQRGHQSECQCPMLDFRSSGLASKYYGSIVVFYSTIQQVLSNHVNVYFVMGFRPFRLYYFTCTAHLYLYCTLLVLHTYASYIRH